MNQTVRHHGFGTSGFLGTAASTTPPTTGTLSLIAPLTSCIACAAPVSSVSASSPSRGVVGDEDSDAERGDERGAGGERQRQRQDAERRRRAHGLGAVAGHSARIVSIAATVWTIDSPVWPGRRSVSSSWIAAGGTPATISMALIS